MATVKIMQGDSYAIPIELKQDGMLLTPEMVEDLEVCVGENLRKIYSGGGVGYDASRQQWYIRPTQQETMAMEVDSHDVIVRVKYLNLPDGDVVGAKIGSISVLEGRSEEVL